MEKYLLAGGLACAVAGAYSDVRSGRIPNRMTYGALLAGLAARFFVSGWTGGLEGILATLICGGVFLGFFMLGGMGAGGVKVMGGSCCLGGSRPGLISILA